MTTTEQIIAAALVRTGKSADDMSAAPQVIRHPAGDEAWAIRMEWKLDADRSERHSVRLR